MRRLVIALLVLGVLPATASAAPIEGKWRGTVSLVKGGSGSFPVVMKIGTLRQGRPSGRIFNPGSPCKGKAVYLGRKGPKYRFRYRESTKTRECTGDDRVTVSPVGGRLRWTGVSPAGLVGKGTLDRV